MMHRALFPRVAPRQLGWVWFTCYVLGFITPTTVVFAGTLASGITGDSKGVGLVTVAASSINGDTLSAPDSGDTLHFVDIDASLLAGQGVLLAFEDTIPFAVGTIETLLVKAPRLTVAEVVRLIGERMEEDRARRKEHAFTTVSKAIIHFDDQRGEDHRWEIYETAERYRWGSDGTYQQARLWERQRKYKGQELVEEKVNEDVEVSWEELSGAMMEAIPFSLQSGDQYNYAILDRNLIGLNVVYEVAYEPKSKFKALPKGRVWLDTSDFVIRRVEAEMTDAVPMPLIIESIPVYKLRRVQKGEHWVLSDVYAEIKLREVPVLKIPASIEFFLRASHHVINGVAYPDEDDDS